jgi:azurin
MSARFAAAVLTIVLGAAAAATLAGLRPRSPAPVEPAAPATADETAARTVTLTALDNMTYSATTVSAAPGELLAVSLQTVSSLPREIVHHNFVLLQAGAPAEAFVRLAAQSHAHAQHVPPALKHMVLASTDIAGAGETVTTTFRAPARPGKYVYLCSVPGHFGGGMKGVLIVEGGPDDRRP